MRVVFLDIDGVLNDLGWLYHSNDHIKPYIRGSLHHSKASLSPGCVRLFNHLHEKYPFHIVLISAWRSKHTIEEMRRVFSTINAPLLEYLPNEHTYSNSSRGLQIKKWLQEHPEVSSYLILEDEPDERMDRTNLVQPSRELGGFNFRNMQEAFEVFQKQENLGN